MSFGSYNKYLKKYKKTKEGDLIFETFSFKSPKNDKGFNVRTAMNLDYSVCSDRFKSGLNVDKDKPFEVFCISWDQNECGDPFRYDDRPAIKGSDYPIGNVPFCDRGAVMKLIRSELVE